MPGLAAPRKRPEALFGEWLLACYSPSELRIFLGTWDDTRPVLLKVAFDGTAPDALMFAVVEELQKLELLDAELLARFAADKPRKIDSLLAAVWDHRDMQAHDRPLKLIHTAKQRAVDSGAISRFGERLHRIKDWLAERLAEIERDESSEPDKQAARSRASALRTSLVLELNDLEKKSKDSPPIAHEVLPAPPADDLPAPPVVAAPAGPAAAPGRAEALRRRIEQAIVMDDLATATQVLSTYLKEHRGLDRERETAPTLARAAREGPAAVCACILEILSETDAAAPPRRPVTQTEAARPVVLVRDDLEKSYAGGAFHLSCAGFELRLGEVVGVVGPNASGKSTFLRILAGQLAADRGGPRYPLLDVEDRRGNIRWEQAHRGIHFLPQRPPPWRERLFHELCLFVARCGRRATNTDKGEPPKKVEDLVGQMCDRLGLGEHLGKRWEELSGGLRIRFELARALLSPASLLVLDEPLAPLDLHAQGRFLEELRTDAHARAIVLSTQHVWEVGRIADRMLRIVDRKVDGKIDRKVEEHVPKPLTCLELTAKEFTGGFVDRLRRLGAVRYTTSQQTVLLLETNLTSVPLVHAEVARAAHVYGTRLDSVRDISGSVVRTFWTAEGA